MIQLSIITNAISNAAHSAAFHAKNLCVNSKVDTVFRTTVGALKAHPYIPLIGAGVAIYCYQEKIGGLVNKVKQAACFLYTKISGLMTSLINLFRRNPTSTPKAPTNASGSNELKTLPTSIPKVTPIPKSPSGSILDTSKNGTGE